MKKSTLSWKAICCSSRAGFFSVPGLVLIFGLSSVCFSFSLQAEENTWRFCRTPAKQVTPITPELSSSSKNSVVVPDVSSPGEMKFSADQFEVIGSMYHLKGKVRGGRGDQHISADSLNYDRNTNLAVATGNVRYEHGERTLAGDIASINIEKNTGRIKPANFWFSERHMRGSASEIQFNGVSETRLQDVTFTTCDEGSDDWLLKASSLRLDTVKNEGVARHARIKFMSVPIFYFPYLSFPLEGRKSGFLAPAVGESTNSGTELSVPYYWNIAPHRDATLTPRYLSLRGWLFETEFRYLNENSHGQVGVAHISDDRVLGEDRTAVNFFHQGNPSPGWRTQVVYRHVSDEDYLDDFGNELAASSATHLERRASLDYRNSYLQASLLAQDYQTLDLTLPGVARPYQRMPQLRLSSRDWKGPAGIMFNINAEAVRFDRSEGVVGKRFDLQPRISWPWRGEFGFVVPRLTYQYTQYQLEKSDPAYDVNPSRSLPIFSLDSGLFFDRELGDSTAAKWQTLEPRIFFLHVPYRDQENLIVDELTGDSVFDSSIPLFSLSQMFRENRFLGGDRVGDARQLSAALTTRFLSIGGRELLAASVGRSFYFQDREVTLPGGIAETDTASDWVAEVKSHWTPALSTRASIQWDSNSEDMERGSANLLYKRDTRHVFRLAYRFEEGNIEQSDVAIIWPLASRWNLVARWLHSIQDDVTLESLKGIEYDSCCWTARLVQRSYRIDALDEDESNTIWFQLELKGLTSVGKGIKNLLARDIISP